MDSILAIKKRSLFDGLDMDGDGSVSYKEWTETLQTNSEWTYGNHYLTSISLARGPWWGCHGPPSNGVHGMPAIVPLGR